MMKRKTRMTLLSDLLTLAGSCHSIARTNRETATAFAEGPTRQFLRGSALAYETVGKTLEDLVNDGSPDLWEGTKAP